MDTAAAVEVEEILKPLYDTSGKDVIIECEKLEYIASSGLRILLGILKAAKASGSKVTLRGVNKEIKNAILSILPYQKKVKILDLLQRK